MAANRPTAGAAAAVNENDWRPLLRGSTFAPTVRLLRKRLRVDLLRLYGALRSLDDLVDERQPEAEERVGAVEAWCRDGSALSPETRVFTDLARRGLRPEPVAAFCLAMRHDLERLMFDTEADLDLYCERGSGAAAVMVAQIAGAPSPEVERGMRTLGKAVQLAHILRDIDVDQADGRTYIPRETIERFGSIEAGKREDLLRYQIARADRFFDEGSPSIELLNDGRRWVAASCGLYRETLRQIERTGYGRNPGRIVVPKWRQYAIVARALLTAK